MKILLSLIILLLTFIPFAYSATATYYFNAKSTSNWTDSANMIDGNTGTFAYSSTLNTEETLTGNTCTGDELGTITKVEISVYGATEAAGNSFTITPTYNGVNGSGKLFIPGTTPALAAYQAITTDPPNGPNPWTWADVVSLGAKIKQGTGTKQEDVYVVYVKVTYNDTGKSKLTNSKIGTGAKIN